MGSENRGFTKERALVTFGFGAVCGACSALVAQPGVLSGFLMAVAVVAFFASLIAESHRGRALAAEQALREEQAEHKRQVEALTLREQARAQEIEAERLAGRQAVDYAFDSFLEYYTVSQATISRLVELADDKGDIKSLRDRIDVDAQRLAEKRAQELLQHVASLRAELAQARAEEQGE